MEQTARVPNPVSGRLDDTAPPATPLMVVGRYLCALFPPTWVLLALALGEESTTWPVMLGMVVAMYLCAAAAHGSWWRSSWPLPAGWVTATLAQVAVAAVGVVASIVTGEPLVMAFAMTLLIGAVLGVAALHAWTALRARRR
ncbi:hypothetical protein [Agrococcus carbonis]|uniref:Uncharacterized protein n=1 Tax=Agrococcus carbonis TaxID=684552 RepID=A0A1H1SFH1_9MICO|nr:hypothetical protein [Agrococcus carbonis]SDS46603.1 hypothetical protein SAMN04489719_2383 [Agrococcus carbonis]